MLIFVPVAVVAEFFLHSDMLIFLASALAPIPLAGILGEATEELAIHTGPKIADLLNAARDFIYSLARRNVAGTGDGGSIPPLPAPALSRFARQAPAHRCHGSAAPRV